MNTDPAMPTQPSGEHTTLRPGDPAPELPLPGGGSLHELSAEKDVLLVFLRHFG